MSIDPTCCKDDRPPLPDNSSDRLREVAKIIREHPEKYNQEHWVVKFVGEVDPEFDWDLEEAEDFNHLNVDQALGLGAICGTVGCQAGWLVALTPPEQLPLDSVITHWDQYDGVTYDWELAGQFVGELSRGLAKTMFHADFGRFTTREDAAALLEFLAEQVPEDRNLDFVVTHQRDLWMRLVTMRPDTDKEYLLSY